MSAARVPTLEPDLPHSGNAASRWFGRVALAILGWRIRGNVPNRRKLVLIVAPHTSNWDVVICVAAKTALGLPVLWLAKHTLFFYPLGFLIRALGGIPVNRSESHKVVREVADEFGRRERLVLGVAPEGTRKNVERWRTGFYHIAREAQVPIATVALNWSEHTVDVGELFVPSGDFDRDIGELRARFAGLTGRRGN